jgi:hypothetical protein
MPRTKFSSATPSGEFGPTRRSDVKLKLTDKQSQSLDVLSGPAKNILLGGGSRSGKTFFLVLCIVLRALRSPRSRHCILRYRFNAAKRSIWYDTLPKVLEVACPGLTFDDNKSDWFFRFPNRSEIWLGGLDDKERVEKILGNEYATMFFNECSEMNFDGVVTARTRLAQRCVDGKTNEPVVNRAFYDCNPPTKSHWAYKEFIRKVSPVDQQPLSNPDNYAYVEMNPEDNKENLPAGYIEDILDGLPERARLRFRDGKWLDDREGSLWNRSMIDPYRRTAPPPNLRRIVVAIDPAVTAKLSSAETGMVVVGEGFEKGKDGKDEKHLYVLDDGSLRASPGIWAREAVGLYRKWKADRIIGEVNNGGDLIETNLRTVDETVPYTSVRATRGKTIRAEPISAMYEKGKVHHCGSFPELEDQMCSFVGTLDEESPDRMDSLVWGGHFLIEGGGGRAGVW